MCEVAEVLKIVARREAAQKLRVTCPSCGDGQVQLRDWMSSASQLEYKCRVCRHVFTVQDNQLPE